MKNKKIDSDVKKLKNKSHPFWSFFWLTFLVVSLWYAWYSFYVPSNDKVWSSDIELSKEIAINSNKNILIFFTGKWCSPCRIMKREVFADNKVMKSINLQVVPVEINIDDPSSKNIVKHYNIGATPTTIFINPEGKVMDYAVGKVGKTKFIEMLEKQKGFTEK
ncbi:thioredoxin family protein [Polaribacter vadi]|uniref:thioredoxin family protein n=1 Tax=Polaribacter TaxID=52959 RepID=UPI001C09CF2E|nr:MULTISPECIES: thioredoxin fold domain-containing protein [Polaribacter]MBU3010694.1 thioredoxin family protein [Polaribacter vadi]MDO6740505.1 thioredoxin family protein [Polaribacter sp. 1_MG-2023]